VNDGVLASGLSLASLIYVTKYVSGGHLNPAVSLAATLSGHIDVVRGFSYIAVQVWSLRRVQNTFLYIAWSIIVIMV
jgi:glycerol uptake facilitator-like aquaporin